uniref:Uncharacterized protein n=1 Tax=Ditylenchus dipsaci TaxID=166011 RepID=A0A915ERB6_9BILA
MRKELMKYLLDSLDAEWAGIFGSPEEIKLVCQENDYCLSGWGSCHQRYRNVDVLRRVGNDWRPTTISTASCCDCKVKAGSQIHPLVVGKNKRLEGLDEVNAEEVTTHGQLVDVYRKAHELELQLELRQVERNREL